MFPTSTHPWAIQDLAFLISAIFPALLVGLVFLTLRCGCAAWEFSANDPSRRRRCRARLEP